MENSYLNYGPLSNSKPKSVTDQIDILRSYWPQLIPDKALAYYEEVYSHLRLPDWVEGAFVIIRPGYFSQLHGEEVYEIYSAVNKAFGFKDYRSEQVPHMNERNRRIIDERYTQLDSDIGIIPGQFGLKFQGTPVINATSKLEKSELLAGVMATGAMLITHPERLTKETDMWAICGGDEFSDEWVPYFKFRNSQLCIGAISPYSADPDCGIISGIAI